MSTTPSGNPRLEIFANAAAGTGRGGVREVEEELDRCGVPAAVQEVEPARLTAAVRRAAERNDLVGVCGGDGTLMAAAEALAGGKAALAPIPTGTLNHFARRVGLDGIAPAVLAIARGGTVHVPVGHVDGAIFLNTATFGLYADVVRQREKLRPWLHKWPAAAIALIGRLVRMRRLHVTLEVEGERLERFTPLVWVGVGWGSFPRVHQAPDQGQRPDLEIVILRPSGRFGILGLALRFLKYLVREERPVEDQALEVIHARSLLIHSAEMIGVTRDGEVLRLAAPVFVGVVDDALRVISPD